MDYKSGNSAWGQIVMGISERKRLWGTILTGKILKTHYDGIMTYLGQFLLEYLSLIGLYVVVKNFWECPGVVSKLNDGNHS